MYQNPLLLKQQFPTDVAELTKVIMQSLLVDDEKRDVRPLMSILQRIETLDSRMKRHIKRRKTLIAAADWNIVAEDKADAEAAKLVKKRIGRAVRKYFKSYVESELYGCSLAELEYKQKSYGWVPVIKRRYQPVELEPNAKYFMGIAILDDAAQGKFTRREIPENERHTFLANCSDDLEPGGIFRSLIFHEYIQNITLQEWEQFIQFLKGIIQGTHEPGATAEEKAAGVKALETAVERNFIFTSKRVGFDFHRIVEESSGKSFEAIQALMRDDIEIAVTGTSTLAGDRQRNAPTVQYNTEEDIAFWGRQEFADIINEQLLTWDYWMNVGKDYEAEIPWKFEWQIRRTEDREGNARIIETLHDLVDIPLAEIERLTGVRLAPNEGEVMIPKRQGTSFTKTI